LPHQEKPSTRVGNEHHFTGQSTCGILPCSYNRELAGKGEKTVIKAIVDLVIAFLDLVATMTRSLRKAVVKMGWGLAFIVIAALLVLASAVFFLWGLFQYFAALLSPVASAFIVSLVALALAAVAGWNANRQVR
jgi:hypothetical protein